MTNNSQDQAFDKPTNEWIVEKELVDKSVYVLNPETKKAELKTIKEEVSFKTMYNTVVNVGSYCADNDHYWNVFNSGEQIFKCNKCGAKIGLNPIKDKVVDGKIVPRK